MKRLKDFFYNKNDIIIVLLIVAAASFIIYDRIDAIMTYPETYAREIAQTATEETSQPQTESSDAATSDSTNDGDAAQTNSDGAVTITIDDSDTSATVADKLQAAGLVSSADTFESYVSDAGKSGSIRSGTFQIPSDSTDEEILNIIAQ